MQNIEKILAGLTEITLILWETLVWQNYNNKHCSGSFDLGTGKICNCPLFHEKYCSPVPCPLFHEKILLLFHLDQCVLPPFHFKMQIMQMRDSMHIMMHGIS
jgi:hypothetical protein